MDTMLRLINKLTDFLSGQIQGLLIFLMMALVIVDVTSRYVLNNPLSIAEEFGGYLLVAISCMGLAYAWQQRSHVRVEFLIKNIPVRAQRFLRLFTILLALIFAGVTAYAAYELVSFSFMFKTRSGSWLRTPVAWPQITIIIGSVLIFLQLIAELIMAVRRLDAPEEEGE